MSPNDFIFRERFYKDIQAIEAASARLAAYDLLCCFGVTKENHIERYPTAPEVKEALAPVLDHAFACVEAPRQKREPNSFLFRESFYTSIQEIEEPSSRLACYEILCEFGISGVNRLESYPIEPEKKVALALALGHSLNSVEATKLRYERAVENGRKGGLKGGKLGGRGHKKQAPTPSPIEQESSNRMGGA